MWGRRGLGGGKGERGGEKRELFLASVSIVPFGRVGLCYVQRLLLCTGVFADITPKQYMPNTDVSTESIRGRGIHLESAREGSASVPG